MRGSVYGANFITKIAAAGQFKKNSNFTTKYKKRRYSKTLKSYIKKYKKKMGVKKNSGKTY